MDEAITSLFAALEAHAVQYAVFGAVAMGLHGLTRFTEDLDLFIAPTAENVARLKAALQSVFADPAIDQISAADLLGDYPAVQYAPPTGTFHVDILTRLGEAFSFADLEVMRQSFGGLTVSVVTPKTLYRMKRDTVRLKDRADADAIRRRFDVEHD